MHIQAAKRLDTLTTGIFTELVHAKRQATARGRSIIDLSVGSPDMAPTQNVMETLLDSIQNPTSYGYTLGGIPAFHEAVAHFYQTRYGVTMDPHTQVLQLLGSQDGLAHLSLAFLNDGDIVLVPDPGYPIYEANVALAGGVVYPMPLRAENNFLPIFSDIPHDVRARARMMILNYPGNPVTALANADFFRDAVAFAKANDIFIVHDFAYSELVFDGARAVSFLSVEGASEVGIEFNSMSKTFNMAGCRIGYVLGNARAIAILAQLKSHIDYGVFLPLQRAAVAALTADHDHLAMQAQIYESRRDALMQGLAASGWKVNKSPATMFLWTQIPFGWTSRGFSFSLLENTGVAVTPGNAFGQDGEGYVRIALVQTEPVLLEAASRIDHFLRTAQPS